VTERAVLDTGPLVALLNPRDSEHARCVAAAKNLRTPLVTCWPVLTEAAHLLQGRQKGLQGLNRMVQTGAVKLIELDAQALAWMVGFLERYASIRAQFADAAVMYVAEHEGIDTVFTVDRRDFSIYRTGSGSALSLVPQT